MNDKTLIERLREHRVILKSGDYDGAQLMRAWCDMINAADTIEAQTTRIEALEAALRKIEGQAVCVAMPATEDEMRDWLQNILETTQQALESQP